MTETKVLETHRVLSLKQIASWQLPDINNAKSEIVAGIPSLQRGAVWEPQQIEMLWDSILRGFPIGSIVIANKIKNQKNQQPATHINANKQQISLASEYTHDILDGQQRCNAIAWGFADPWKEGISDDFVLWLDLLPGDKLKNSNREYLFRVTTKAHPWGFKHDNNSSNLSHEMIGIFNKDLIEYHKRPDWPEHLKTHLISEDNFKRPAPKVAFPFDAIFPVPVSLLFKYFENEELNWNKLADEEWIKLASLRAGKNISDLNETEKTKIEKGLKTANQACMIAQQVPDLIERIEDIEKIFQRLNNQGTALDNEELAYCLIKAYWPEVEEKIRQLPSHTTEARMVGLAIRVALTKNDADKINPEQTIDQIRSIFKTKLQNSSNNHSETNNKQDNKYIDNRITIEEYIGGDELKNALNWIDSQFLYNKKSCEYGLPKYLRSSLAWSSPDIFAWLLWLAKQYNYAELNHTLRMKIIGLALTIHWFDVKKSQAIDVLVKNHSSLEKIKLTDLNEDETKPAIRMPLSKKELEEALQLSNDSSEKQLEHWKDFWQGVVNRDKDGNRYSDDKSTERANKYGHIIGKLKNERELLVYVQREYIETVFEGFDPSNKLMWKGHNRPWDYDHILPSNTLDARGSRSELKYHTTCKAWQASIGNLIAVDFSFNRQAQDTKNACDKYADHPQIDILTNELKCFELKRDDTVNPIKSKQFVLATKNRLLEIYEKWFDTLKIGDYLG